MSLYCTIAQLCPDSASLGCAGPDGGAESPVSAHRGLLGRAAAVAAAACPAPAGQHAPEGGCRPVPATAAGGFHGCLGRCASCGLLPGTIALQATVCICVRAKKFMTESCLRPCHCCKCQACHQGCRPHDMARPVMLPGHGLRVKACDSCARCAQFHVHQVSVWHQPCMLHAAHR